MSSCTSSSESVGDETSEYECCPLRFGLLRDTSDWGKIVSTGPWLCCTLLHKHIMPRTVLLFEPLPLTTLFHRLMDGSSCKRALSMTLVQGKLSHFDWLDVQCHSPLLQEER